MEEKNNKSSDDTPEVPFAQTNLSPNKELKEVVDKLTLLIDKAEGKKKRDIWDRFQILASFVSSVLFAGVGLYFTTAYNNREANRQEELQNAQLEMSEREERRESTIQNSQLKVAELNAISTLTPLLANKNEAIRRYARMTLQVLHEDKENLLINDSESNEKTNKSIEFNNKQRGLLQKFANIALKNDAPTETRNDALKNIKDIAVNPKSSKDIKEKATKYFSTITLSDEVPDEIRQKAGKYLKDIVMDPEYFEKIDEEATNDVPAITLSDKVPDQIKKKTGKYLKSIRTMPGDSINFEIQNIIVNRHINNIVLHTSFRPNIKSYRGSETINEIVKFHIETNGWKNAAWHYMISPDGMVWTGRSLNEAPEDVRKHNAGTISVDMILDGDKELPTIDQQKSLGILLSALCKKFRIVPKSNFSANKGFHRDYTNLKTCPGTLIKKEMILDWIVSYGE